MPSGLRQRVDLRDPIVWVAAFVFLLWLAACWYGTGSQFGARTREDLRSQGISARQHLDEMTTGVKRILSVRRGVPATLARDTDIREALKRGTGQIRTQNQEELRQRWSADPALARISQSLQLAASDLSLSVLYVLDTAGNCIASSNLEAPDSFIGGNFRERNYFQSAVRGQPGRQFAVGKVSKQAGIYFSVPIMDGNRIIGAMVGKIEMPILSPWISLADGVLTDDYGVIVLARDRTLEMHALPDAAALHMDPVLRLSRYQRKDVPDLPLTPAAGLPDLMRLPGRDAPLMVLRKDIPELGLGVTVLWPVPQIAQEAQERLKVFWILALLGLLAIGGTATTLLYLGNMSRARRVVEDNEVRFRTLFHGAGDAILLNAATQDAVAPTGPFLEANDTACLLLGYSREELLSRSLVDIEESPDQTPYFLGTSGAAFLERVYRTKDGRLIPVEITARAMHFDGRDVVMSMVRDVSERRAAEAALHENEERYHLIVDSTAEGFWMIGPDSLTQDVNPALCAMLGYSRDEMLGRNPLDFTDGENRKILAEQMGYIGMTSNRYYDIELTRKDGSHIPVFFHASTHFDEEENVLMAFAFVTDLRERKRSEQALREAAENLARAQAIAHLGSWRLNLATDELIWSDETARIFGLPPDMAVTRHFWDPFLHPTDLARRQSALEKALKGAAYDLEFPIEVDGQTKWLRELVAVVQDRDGQALACHGTLQDITQTRTYAQELELHRNHLEEMVTQRTAELKGAEARYRSVVEIAPDGFWTVDEDQRLLEVNDAYVRRSGYSREELLGMRIGDLDCTRDASQIRTNIALIAERGSLRLETRHRAKDGSIWPVEVAVSYWKEGRLLFAFLRDITERNILETARETARLEAERLARAKSEFLANMSHEIRTPLNGVLGLAQVGFRENSGRRAQKTFGHILESGKLLLGVVNDILDFSKIEAGRMSVERVPVDLHGLLRQALELQGERARTKGIALRLEKEAGLPAACLGDPLRLSQVLGNLLSNAIKFTEWGTVSLHVGREPEESGDTLVLRVSDTGIGMTAEQITRLFTPFEQADGSTTRRFGGTGLGLAISMTMAKLMGGEIRVKSRIGEGSEFEFRLPLLEPVAGTMTAGQTATAYAPRGKHGQMLAGLSILAAEDNDINRMVLDEMLSTEGAKLTLVENGRLAVERIIADGPDFYNLVLMDIQMPEMDGMEATRRIRELAPRLPIVGQTAHALPEEKERCLAAGMVDHVAKPLEQDALIAAILRHART
ncbi:MAG: PAS domain S-box protein [Rhodocyclaceae bacterium]|nr:PAS domain S-box protein [Rhodocyclaceae bacterium]